MATQYTRGLTDDEYTELATFFADGRLGIPADELEKELRKTYQTVCFQNFNHGDGEGYGGYVFFVLGPILVEPGKGYRSTEQVLIIRDEDGNLLEIDERKPVPDPAWRADPSVVPDLHA